MNPNRCIALLYMYVTCTDKSWGVCVLYSVHGRASNEMNSLNGNCGCWKALVDSPACAGSNRYTSNIKSFFKNPRSFSNTATVVYLQSAPTYMIVHLWSCKHNTRMHVWSRYLHCNMYFATHALLMVMSFSMKNIPPMPVSVFFLLDGIQFTLSLI